MPPPLRKTHLRSASPRKKEFLPDGGPPREVIIKNKIEGGGVDVSGEADDLLEELLNDHSTVSSLGVGGPLASNHFHHTFNKKQNLGKVSGSGGSEGEEEDDDGDDKRHGGGRRLSVSTPRATLYPTLGTSKRATVLQSPGLIAARERYRNQSVVGGDTSDKIHPLVFHNQRFLEGGNEDDEDPARVNMEEVSLGQLPDRYMDNDLVEVIDVEKEIEARRNTASSASFNKANAQALDDTSKTASGTYDSPKSPKSPMRSEGLATDPRKPSLGNRGDTEEEEEDDDECEGSGTREQDTDPSAKDLLNRARDRLTIQKLHEQIGDLKSIIERKNGELEVLAGQLRRAIETKCDLVLAHTELERFHEFNLKMKEEHEKELQKANHTLLEGRAAVEKELMNEMVRLSDELAEMRKQHVQEMQDWERMHKNEMLERDCEIARLKEEIRKLLLRQQNNPAPSVIHKQSGGKVVHQILECA